MALTHDQIAVMYREREDSTPVSYVWLNAKKKDFEKRLAQMQASSAVYRMLCPKKDGFDTGDRRTLVFEQKLVDDSKRYEYKVLKFDFDYTENLLQRKVQIDLTAKSKETLKEMNRLVKEGFVVRDLFESDKVSVLLERPN